jgi:REP element-mobilizing transposase RayT
MDSITWLITSTTYGTWLPGDARGFVGRVWDARPDDPGATTLRATHDTIDTPYDRDMPGLEAKSRSLMKGEPILLTAEQAHAVLNQFVETAEYRQSLLHAASVMANQFHLVVSAPAGIQTDAVLRDFKSYAARVLNRQWGKPRSGTWWTASGSRRRLPDDRAVESAIRYVWRQHRVLARWLNPIHSAVKPPSGGRQPAVDDCD